MQEATLVRDKMWRELRRDLTQDALAREGKAKGQCPECRAYRWDGGPPFFHVRGCSKPRA